MRKFQILVASMFVCIVVYTLIVGANHGWNLLPVFFGDILAMNWPGQFNFDFMGFLVLSSVWVSWRHHFSIGGFALGAGALFGGIMFLSAYLLIASMAANGNVNELLLGKRRALS